MSKLKKILVVFVACMGISTVALGSTYIPNPPEPSEWIPIDGGVSALIVAGVGYGIKKYRDYRLSKNEDKN